MVLDIPGGLFEQRDVRETPTSTATATAVGLTDGKYVVLDYHADMTDERKLTAGTGVKFTDGGANSTVTLNSDDGEIDHDALNNFAANEHFTEASIDHTNITAGDGSDHSLLANKTSYASITSNSFTVKSSATTTKFSGNLLSGTENSTFFATIQLPHGAVVTGATVYGNSSNAWVFERVTFSNSSSTMATAATNTEDTSISNATVDNSTYSYGFKQELDSGERLYGARVKYTTDYV
ncbi:MAG: hypothetical protein KAS32_31055 [Candidatus Peribacteraceae bacterium]|nr:hypothetical protein [Candidatus Peribacteraceae bacterium]